MARENMCADLFIVLKGEVALYADYRKQTERLLTTIGSGDFFGETAVLLEQNCPYTAVTLSDVFAVPISRNTILATFVEEPELAFELMKAMSARMEELQAAYAGLAGQRWLPTPAAPPAAPLTPEPQKPAAAATPKAAAAMPKTASKPATAPPAAHAPAAPAAAPVVLPSALFPEGHGHYALPALSGDPAMLMDKHFTCPYCKHRFTAQQVRASRLAMAGTDADLRYRYVAVEPMYYDVVTCPECLYSALGDQFATPENPRADLTPLQTLKPQLQPLFTGARSADAVFTSYYLALLCAPLCFYRHQLAEAKLLLKLSRVYQDGGDEALEQQTAAKARDAYLYLYTHEENDANTEQQLCVILGELYLKSGELKSARDFFFQAKTNREGSPVLRDHADNRLSDIKNQDS